MTRAFGSLHTKQDMVTRLNELIDDLDGAFRALDQSHEDTKEARYQIERAIAQLETVFAVSFPADYTMLETTLDSVLAQLKAYLAKE